MDQALLEAIAHQVLVPLLPGSTLVASVGSTPREDTVAFNSPTDIAFKVDRKDLYRLILHRSQPFDKHASSELTEWRLVNAFVEVAKLMEPGLDSEYRDEVIGGFEKRIVALCLAGADVDKRRLSLDVLNLLQRWAAVSYEGGRVAASIGVEWGAVGTGPALADFDAEDFAMVVSNGFDTLVRIDGTGILCDHVCLTSPAAASQLAPFRSAALASWASPGKIAFVLNRLGEILVFAAGQLMFARRFGRWFFLTHETALHQMKHPHDLDLRRCVYESALDASFARTGACIGVVSNDSALRWRKVVAPDDHLATSITPKARALSRLVAGRAFDALDRRLRQELLAIDGATVMNHKGEVLAVGAIVKVDGGSTGGGRKAAAIELGKLGMGLKISQDGGITGFKGGRVPAFSVMG